ncbi:FAD/NAD(P)-binding domain-containing protein [Bimuria novae-zelandiae CBS 107.79]|uniref:FAD/NAD(P)-binding domain-containing protein n=1 Tax=Bimuria novae-zelandiae CBS 107.79 TaxID=1447943 RepID=A0A6A5VQP5_9PLEO|nr:FAD/NAD(P)-binding domain-containing protein [Bimuria novae-zelandiae CBS 107.79]
MVNYDLIVVGSGFTGCITTLNFLETGKKLDKNRRVALIEVGKEGERCGASRWKMAYLRLDKDLAFDSDRKHEMALASNGLADHSYCATLEREAQATAKYVGEHGVKFNHHDEENVLLEFKTDQHFVFPEGGGKAIIDCLIGHIEEYKNAEIHSETEARYLLTDKRGGYQGLARYVGRRTHELPLIAPGLKYNRRAGLNMALEVGASTAGSFDGMHCELVDTRAAKPDAVIWDHNYGIVVNEHCKRFYDEGKRHLFATFEMIALELWRDHNQKGFFITDEPIMKRFRPGWAYDTTDQEPETADTTRELVEKLKVEPDALEATVKEFNKACNDKPFDLMKLDGKATTGLNPNKTNRANPINTPPFCGYPVTSHLTFTYDGITTNNEAQVLSTNEVPIPGLWAAGELSGIFYNEYPPATSILRSLTFGRLAGTKIAEQLGSKSWIQSAANTVRSEL